MVLLFLRIDLLTKLHYPAKIILQTWSCEQNLVTLTFLRKKLSLFYFHMNLTREKNEWSCFKFNTLEMMFGMALNLYKNAAKCMKA